MTAHEHNPRSLQEMKDNILKETAIIPMQQLCCVPRSVISKCEVRYKSGYQHLGTVLQNTVRRTDREIRAPNSRRTPASQRASSSDRCRAEGPLCSDRLAQSVYNSRTLCQERL
jgi:hypothetical protein